MDVLVQHPLKLRADIGSSCNYGRVDDKLDSGMRECYLMEDVGSQIVDDLVMLLPLPLDECVNNCHGLEKPEDIEGPKTTNNVLQTCCEEDATTLDLEIAVASHMEEDVYNIGKSTSPIYLNSSPIDIAEIMSAMKGSRQRKGLEVKPVSVSWAPDVYDPPVTPRCHSVKENSKKHSRLHKKSLKSKHKSKSIRNGSKVKK